MNSRFVGYSGVARAANPGDEGMVYTLAIQRDGVPGEAPRVFRHLCARNAPTLRLRSPCAFGEEAAEQEMHGTTA